jgi:hypothetical protein
VLERTLTTDSVTVTEPLRRLRHTTPVSQVIFSKQLTGHRGMTSATSLHQSIGLTGCMEAYLLHEPPPIRGRISALLPLKSQAEAIVPRSCLCFQVAWGTFAPFTAPLRAPVPAMRSLRRRHAVSRALMLLRAPQSCHGPAA